MKDEMSGLPWQTRKEKISCKSTLNTFNNNTVKMDILVLNNTRQDKLVLHTTALLGN